MLIDTHTHLNLDDFDSDRDVVIVRAHAAGVESLIVVGIDVETTRAAIALAEAHPHLYASAGLHPHAAASLTPAMWNELRDLARHPKVVAIGETGLDYYRNLSPRQAQQRVFEQHLALAEELNKPVIVHNRDAHAAILDTLRAWVKSLKQVSHPQPSAVSGQPPALSAAEGSAVVGHETSDVRLRGVMHAFSGSVEMAQECIALGFAISFAGPITFLNARRLLDVARAVPLEHIVIETDCPYLAPHPHRGQRNEPAHVRLVAARLAELKGMPPQQVAETTTANACRLFRTSYTG